MRIDVPEHLAATFWALENEAFLINQGEPGAKRSIKFDDERRSFYLDVKLPDAAKWVQLTAEEVLEARAGRPPIRKIDKQHILAIGRRAYMATSDARPPPPKSSRTPGPPGAGGRPPPSPGSGFHPGSPRSPDAPSFDTDDDLRMEDDIVSEA